jgi:hypothetical protein
MPNELVGLENVPNCYIARIILDDNTTKSFTCSVNLELFDATEGDRTIWGYNSLFSDFLKVALIETRRTSLAQRLTNGTLSPLPSKVRQNPFFDETTKIHITSVKEFTKLNGAYVKKLKFEVPVDAENLSVFAFCYIDMKALSAFLQLDMTGELSRYHGAITSERVLSRGTTVKTSTVFYKPDNTIWSGPVHQHDGMYMEGSKHTTEPHNVLRMASVQNLKLIDRRGKNFSDRQRESIKDNPVISDLHLSVNNNEDLSGLFFVNMKQLLLTRTKLGTKIANLSARMFNDFLTQIEISQLIVKRFRANVRLVKGKLGTYKNSTINTEKSDIIAASIDIAPYSLKPQELLKERYLFANRNIRAFEFTDNSKTKKNNANFKYSVELTIKDKSQEYIDGIILQLRSSLSRMKEIHHALSRKDSYDYELRQLRKGVSVPDDVTVIIETYYNKLQYFKDFDDTEKRRLINEKIKGFSAASYSPTTSEKLINDLDKLSSLMFSRFGVHGQYNNKAPKTTKKAFIPARIFLKKTFEDNVNFFNYSRSYNYISPITTTGIPVLTTDELLSRGDQELDRFFYRNQINQSLTVPDQLRSLPQEMQSALTSLEPVKVSYFAPLSLQYKDETVPFTADAINDSINEVNRLVTAAKQISTKVRQTQTSRNVSGVGRIGGAAMGGLTSGDSSLTTEVVSNTNESEEELQRSLIESFYYLGENSEFVNVDDNYTPPATVEDTQAAEQLNASFANDPTLGSAAYNFSSPNNVVSFMVQSANYTAEDVSKLAAQTKALINSRSNAVKNGILQSPVDPFKEVSTLNTYEILYKTLQVIEKIIGFATDSNGVEIVTQPIFRLLDTSDVTDDSTLVCRMRYWENAPMSLGPKADLMFPVRNQTFIVSNKDLSAPQYREIPALNIANVPSVVSPIIKYSTTNIVTQRHDSSYVKAKKIIGTSQETNQRVGSRVTNRGQITDSSATRRQRRATRSTSGGRSGGGGY